MNDYIDTPYTGLIWLRCPVSSSSYQNGCTIEHRIYPTYRARASNFWTTPAHRRLDPRHSRHPESLLYVLIRLIQSLSQQKYRQNPSRLSCLTTPMSQKLGLYSTATTNRSQHILTGGRHRLALVDVTFEHPGIPSMQALLSKLTTTSLCANPQSVTVDAASPGSVD